MNWSSSILVGLTQDGMLTTYPVGLLENTDYEYKLSIVYWTTFTNPLPGQTYQLLTGKSSQMQEFRTGAV